MFGLLTFLVFIGVAGGVLVGALMVRGIIKPLLVPATALPPEKMIAGFIDQVEGFDQALYTYVDKELSSAFAGIKADVAALEAKHKTTVSTLQAAHAQATAATQAAHVAQIAKIVAAVGPPAAAATTTAPVETPSVPAPTEPVIPLTVDSSGEIVPSTAAPSISPGS